jgi:hypothetical protein
MEAEIQPEKYTTKDTAQWLVQRDMQYRDWFMKQLAIMALFSAEGQHDRALAYLARAAEISDELRAMGAMHLLH